MHAYVHYGRAADHCVRWTYSRSYTLSSGAQCLFFVLRAGSTCETMSLQLVIVGEVQFETEFLDLRGTRY